MGYSYEIILEYREGDEWKNLEHYSNIGSYGSSDYHYFFNNLNYSNLIKPYNFLYDSNEYYLIDIEKMTKDYLEIYENNSKWKDKLIKYIKEVDNIELVKEYINDLEYDIRVPLYFDELENWYNIVNRNKLLGYDNIRLIYGLSN
jgi:hypothetical protein